MKFSHPMLLVFAAAVSACAVQPAPAPTPAPVSCCPYGTPIADRLYFGRDIAGVDTVSDAQWAAFLRDVVAAEFRDEGWTVYRAEGAWNDATLGVIYEQTFVLEQLHPLTARSDSVMERIARAYIQRFRQSAVLRVKSPASATLIR